MICKNAQRVIDTFAFPQILTHEINENLNFISRQMSRSLHSENKCLDRDVEDGNAGPISVIVGFYIGVSLIMCYAAKAPAEYMKLAILHSQMIQAVAIMNMDSSDDS
jgi:hypothetical protein